MNRIILRAVIGVLIVGAAFFSSAKHNSTQPHNETSSSSSAERQGVHAGNFAPGRLHEHYLKHGYQFGNISEEEYLEDARKLLDASGGDVQEKIRENGDIEHYKPQTHEFAVMTRTGRIRTYFLTNDRYWEHN